MLTVHQIKPKPFPILVNFEWEPAGTEETFVIDGETYKEPTTFIDILITFKDTSVYPTGVFANEYFWRFGDGGIGVGKETTHIFRVPDPFTQVSLVIFDSRGLEWSCLKRFVLKHGERPTIGLPILLH